MVAEYTSHPLKCIHIVVQGKGCLEEVKKTAAKGVENSEWHPTLRTWCQSDKVSEEETEEVREDQREEREE